MANPINDFYTNAGNTFDDMEIPDEDERMTAREVEESVALRPILAKEMTVNGIPLDPEILIDLKYSKRAAKLSRIYQKIFTTV